MAYDTLTTCAQSCVSWSPDDIVWICLGLLGVVLIAILVAFVDDLGWIFGNTFDE